MFCYIAVMRDGYLHVDILFALSIYIHILMAALVVNDASP